MSATTTPALPNATALPVRPDWLAQRQEPILEPNLPIVDPHHHLWDRPENRYMFPDLLADANAGHNIRATVFVDCRSMYRADGPAELSPLGETEFVNGVASMSARDHGIDPPVSRACHRVARHARAACLVRIPRFAPGRRARFQGGDHLIGDFGVVVPPCGVAPAAVCIGAHLVPFPSWVC